MIGKLTNKGRSPLEIWQYIKAHGFLGLVIAKQYGGKGFSPQAHSAVITTLASRSISVAFSVMVPNSVGPADLVARYGTAAQKSYYLPRLASGEEIPCFALTAPEAGSDASAIPDLGVVCEQMYAGKKTLGVILSWNKRYITLAPIATLLGVAFNLRDPEHLLGSKEALGITLALIPASHPGVEVGKRHLAMNLGFMNGPTRGENVFIPLTWLVGGERMVGQGWCMLMEALSSGRAISLLALASASAKVCYRMSGAYARLRKQFNRPIAYFEGIEAPLARIGAYTYILEAIRLISAGALAAGLCPALASAIAKYHSTENGAAVVWMYCRSCVFIYCIGPPRNGAKPVPKIIAASSKSPSATTPSRKHAIASFNIR